jgi:hypothetical protein
MKTVSKVVEQGRTLHLLEFVPGDSGYTDAQLINVANGAPADSAPHHLGGVVHRYCDGDRRMAEVVVFTE